MATYTLDYLVVAGGGGGTGAGAGGYRTSGYGPAPLQAPSLSFANTYSGDTYTVTIGAGGTAPGQGTDSTFSPELNTITSTGGGAGDVGSPGNAGGSGGGGRVYPPEGAVKPQGAGNTPPTPVSQGNPGGPLDFPGPIGPQGGSTIGFSGGGGATAAGSAVSLGTCFAVASGNLNGGDGATNNINGSCTAYAGGGGGYTQLGGGAVAFGTGGTGGGQPGNTPCGCRNGTVNTGGGAGNSYSGGGGTGGSGIVIVRAPSAVTFAVSPGTNTVATCVGPSNDTVATFTVSGTNTLTVT